MDTPFFRQLGRLLSPAGVLAVNYYGGKGPGLKETWCRLRLVFDHGEAQPKGAAALHEPRESTCCCVRRVRVRACYCAR